MAAIVLPPVSRQPSCALCDHEQHVFTRCQLELLRDDSTVLCPCPPHRPPGIYDDPRSIR